MAQFFHIKNNNQYLLFFGANHSNNPNHPQFEALKEQWGIFLKQDKNKCIVLVEGQKVESEKDVKNAIIKNGEKGYITFLATQNKILIKCPEPDLQEERAILLNKFSQEVVAYYYFARAVDRWNRFKSNKKFEDFILPYLERDERVSKNWGTFEFSLKHFKNIHKRLFNNSFNPRNERFFADLTNPTKECGIINEVAKNSGEIRDEFIHNYIMRLWNKGYNIFIVYGEGHLSFQKRQLELKLHTAPLLTYSIN